MLGIRNDGARMVDIKLASPRGFCAGVDRAIEIVRRAIEVYGIPVYVRHEVVHNRTVVQDHLLVRNIEIRHLTE